MKKYMLYAVVIVVYSVVVVLLRHADSEIPNWLFWVLSIGLVAVLSFVRGMGKGDSKESDKNADVGQNAHQDGEKTRNNVLSSEDERNKRSNVSKEDKKTYWVKALEEIILTHCESSYDCKPNFPIKEDTNFKRNLNFDGIDMAEIDMAFEKKYGVRIPDDHPFMHRSANDTDYTVGYYLSCLGVLDDSDEKTVISGTNKHGDKHDGGRFYFYNGRCSFGIRKEEIKEDNVEKNGLKHTLLTESMLMTIIEIRDGMPQFPAQIKMKEMRVGGLFCLAAKVSPLLDDYNQFFIDCKDFVVQVSFTIPSARTNEFLNSFRLEK